MQEGLAKYEGQPSTIAEIKSEVKLIQDILEHIMIKDVHYGTIPGTPKPALYKPGSEKILRTFHIGVDPREDITDLSTNDEIRYRVYVKGFNQTTGVAVGVGVGECSSNEEKYKWRKPVCDEEFNETPDDRKRMVWKRDKKGNTYQQKQIRTNPADVANTILKMAKKRSQIDMTLTVTAASDVFEQDLEDMPEEIREGLAGQDNKSSKSSTVQPGNGTDNKKTEKRTVRDTLWTELESYCNADQKIMADLLKEITVFAGKDGDVFMNLEQIKKPETKEAWIGKTLGKLRDFIKAHPKEGTEECNPENCGQSTMHDTDVWCEKEQKKCKRVV